MHISKNILGGGVLFLMLSTSANAVPINFTETTDFTNFNSSTDDVGDFGIGLNIITGSVKRDSTGVIPPGDYGDFWIADLLPGMQITAIDIVISNHSGNPGFFVGAADNIVGGFGPFNAQSYNDLIGDGAYSLAATIGSYPFTAGQYHFGAATNVGTNTGYSYEWRVSVSAVPVPAAIWLFVSGLAGLYGFSRYRNNP
jgi:hypothetical protein